MNMVKVFILSALALTMAGCWDVEEIDRRDLILAIGLDLESDGRIRSTLQIPLAEYTLPPVAGGNRSKAKKFYTLTSDSHTIIGAASGGQADTIRTLFPGQLKSILLQENVAKKELTEYLDYLARATKIPRSAGIFVCRESAESILEQVPVQETVPGMSFSQQLESAVKKDQTYPMPLCRFIQRLDEPGVDPYAPVISFQKEKKTFEITGLAVFCHDHLTGFLNPEQTRMFGLLTKKLSGGYLEIPLANHQFAAYRSVEEHVRISFINAKPLRINIKLSVNGNLTELAGTPKQVDPSRYQKIKKETREYLAEHCRETISLLQSWQADILDFGLEYRGRYPTEFNPKTWRRQFQQAKVDVNVEFHISRTGLYH